jgi:uncharacterized delta-60 repeat protein
MTPSMRQTSVLCAAAVAIALPAFGAGAGAATATSVAPATPPRLDPTFGHDGRAEPIYERSYQGAYFTAAKVGADGSLLVAHQDEPGGRGPATVSRYQPDGRVDPTFDGEGTMWGLEAVDAEGRTLRTTAIESSFYLERLDPDGSVDPSFGGPGLQVATAPFGIDAILPLPSGKIVVAGIVERPGRVKEVALARFDESGSRDPSFGRGGVAYLAKDEGIGSEVLIGLAEGADEDVLVATNDEAADEEGEVRDGGSRVVAIGPDGRPDPGYGSGGIVSSPDQIGAIEGLPDGGLLLTGEHWIEPRLGGYLLMRGSNVYVARLTAAGAPDSSFGEGDGRTVVDLGGIDTASSLLLRPDGSILVGGATTVSRLGCPRPYAGDFCEETPTLEGFTPSGAPDRGFGRAGVVRLGSLTFDRAPPAAAGTLFLRDLPGGGALAGGGTVAGAFLAEVGPGGGLEPGFGKGGIVSFTRRHGSVAEAGALGVDAAGRILALGETSAGGDGGQVPAAFRFRPNGSVDRDFAGGRGFVPFPGSPIGFAEDLRGGALVLTGKFSDNALTRITPRGALDPRFGDGGIAALPRFLPAVSRGRSVRVTVYPRSVAALPGGGALVAAVSGRRRTSRIDLFRLGRTGELDRSFGHDGILRVAVGPVGERNARAMALMPDGRIVLAGSVRGGKPGRERQTAAVIRLLPDGHLDPSFGHGGLATLPVAGKGVFTALAIGSRGEVVAGGRNLVKRERLGLTARFSPDGVPDRGFARRAARTFVTAENPVSPPAKVLLWGKRIVMLPIYRSPFATVYSDDGTFLRQLAFGKTRRPTTAIGGGALQRGKLVIATRTAGQSTFTLSRLPGPARR